jgi:hypothetical protein
VLWPGAARARSEMQYSYAYEQVFPASLRFFRIDEKLKIVEKDPDAGYVVFELTQDKKTFTGTAEYVKEKDRRGRPAVKLIVKIGDRPDYVEQGMLDRLERKLLEDLGPPPDPPPDKVEKKQKPTK